MNPVYERIFLQKEKPATLRPGGFTLTRKALRYCSFPEGARVLDLACGTGATVALMMREFGLDAWGVDILADTLAAAGRLAPEFTENRERIIQGNCREIPFPDSSLSGVSIECSLSGLGNTRSILREVKRVLEPGGLLFITDLFIKPGPSDIPQSLFSAGTCPYGALTEQELLEHTGAEGFRNLIWEEHTDLLKDFIGEEIMRRGSLQAVLELFLTVKDECSTFLPGAGIPRFGYFLYLGKRSSNEES